MTTGAAGEAGAAGVVTTLKAAGGEYHVVIEGTDPTLSTEEQYNAIERELGRLTREVLPSETEEAFRRYFVSDAVGQAKWLEDRSEEATSIVQQPPLNGTKVALWVWFVDGGRNTTYRHLFHTQMHHQTEGKTASDTGRGEAEQTEEVFGNYIERLAEEGLTLAANTVRTWIFVQGIDTHYADMVAARRELFEQQGLTPKTHYIASTGIEGKYIHPEVTVLMDAYAVDGLQPGQVTYLRGATHLNQTHQYGVTFERATAIDYGDRRHILVSGTASIDNKGQIVHPGDVEGQLGRVLENIEVLLREGGCELGDIAQMIVYLRDPADYAVVTQRLAKEFPDTPRVIVWAPVCRPGWLVEIECIAIKLSGNDRYAPF